MEYLQVGGAINTSIDVAGVLMLWVMTTAEWLRMNFKCFVGYEVGYVGCGMRAG